KRQYNLPRMEELSEVNHSYCDSSNDPNCIVERQGKLENISSAIDALSGYAKDIVDLVVDLDCSYQAAADHLDIPIGTVRSRLFRARKILKNSVSF
ncbi:MAG: sigma factor-like helix-turn-helix DNA-binding protein, partial [Exilibacterium sp.]